MDDAKTYMNEVTRVGKEITISIEIVNSEKAQELLGTMYDKNIDKFGVAVKSWGFWNQVKANEIRLEKLNQELSRHQCDMQNILAMTDMELLEE